MRGYISTELPIVHPMMSRMRDWEFKIEAHKKFVRLTSDNRALFFALLGKESDLDSYVTSPVYYAMTGRKGLWIYQDGNSYVPLCWHPNVDGQILVFPPRGAENIRIMDRLLTEIPMPPSGIRLARLQKSMNNSAWFSNIEGTSERFISLLPVEETVLDWKYPVRIMSTADVTKMQGNHHLRTRNYIKNLHLRKIDIKQLSDASESQILNFVYRWANQRTSDVNELINLIDPYKQTLNLLHDENFNLDGLIVRVDGHIQAVTMWEYPNSANRIANAWIHLCNTSSFKGISELAMQETSKALYEQGIPYINYGGSETQGLDNYKRKFRPAYSVELTSIDVDVDGVDLILDSLFRFSEERVAA